MKILSMSGFVPEQICDTIRFSQYSGDRNIAHYCGYASDFISQVLHDDSIDGAVFPKSCDSSRIISGYLSGADKFVHQINVPPVGVHDAESFFASSIRWYKEAVESYYGILINDIAERTEIVNARNLKLKELYGSIGELSFPGYLAAIHDMLRKPLREQRSPLSVRGGSGGKPVFIVGSFLANVDVAEAIERAGLNVVGDTLTESGRLASIPPVDDTEDIYTGIAKSLLHGRISPTQNSFRRIIRADMAELQKKGAKGVIFITQKYCEPYDFLFSVYKPVLDSAGIPSLRISLSDTQDARKTELALEVFADIL